MPRILERWKNSRILKKAQKLLLKGRDKEAAGILEAFLSQNPGFEEAYIWLAVAKNSLKDYEGALEAIDKVIEKSTMKHFCKTVKGETLLFMGKFEESMLLLSQALDLSPDNTRIAYLLGLNHIRTGNIEKAAEFFELAIKYDRELVESRLLAMAELYLYKNSGR